LFIGLVNAALTRCWIAGQDGCPPNPRSIPGVAQLWGSDWQDRAGRYGLLIIVGGIVVMAHESVQTRYSIKEIGADRAGFLASALSLFFADKIIRWRTR